MDPYACNFAIDEHVTMAAAITAVVQSRLLFSRTLLGLGDWNVF